ALVTSRLHNDGSFPVGFISRSRMTSRARRWHLPALIMRIPTTAAHAVESLESRVLLSATLTVDSSGDQNVPDGVLTLREAILLAAGQLNRPVTTAERDQVSGPGLAYSQVGPDRWTFTAGVGADSSDTVRF